MTEVAREPSAVHTDKFKLWGGGFGECLTARGRPTCVPGGAFQHVVGEMTGVEDQGMAIRPRNLEYDTEVGALLLVDGQGGDFEVIDTTDMCWDGVYGRPEVKQSFFCTAILLEKPVFLPF